MSSWTGSADLDSLMEMGYERRVCEAALLQARGDLRSAAMLLIHNDVKLTAAELTPRPDPQDLGHDDEPEPEPEPEPSAEEGVPPGSELTRTNTLAVKSYPGEEVTVMYHGTDSRAAQLIASSQRFRRSANTGLLGSGIYVTRSRQKAEGYRVHHPNAGQVGGGEHNLPLPSGEPDPGCILRFRVRLGACKKFRRDCPVEELQRSEAWHEQEIPDLIKTDSMKAAAAAAGMERIDYNSAYSRGCPCCPEHGEDCPGHTLRGHSPLAGARPCLGRCPAGFRKCPLANSAFEEFCVYNPDRIDHIEIVDGPAGLIGYGVSFWGADQATRDAEHRAKLAEFKAWEKANPERLATYRASTDYLDRKTANQMQISLMGQENAAAAARAQASGEEFGGFTMSNHPFLKCNGVFALVEMRDGWPVYRHVADSHFLFYRPSTDEWILCNYYEPDSTASNSRVVSDGGMMPLDTQNWMGKTPTLSKSSGQTIIKVSTDIATVADVQAARNDLQQVKAAAMQACRDQLEGVSSVVLSGTGNTQLDGTYTKHAEDYDGWPHLVNEHGYHLFRHEPAQSWRFGPAPGPKPTSDSTMQAITEDGTISIEVGSWFMLRGVFWRRIEGGLNLRLLRPQELRRFEQTIQDVVQMGFDEETVRALQARLAAGGEPLSPTALVEALLLR